MKYLRKAQKAPNQRRLSRMGLFTQFGITGGAIIGISSFALLLILIRFISEKKAGRDLNKAVESLDLGLSDG